MRLNEELARNPLKNNSPSTLSQPNTVPTSIRLTNLMTSNPVGCFGSSFVWVFFKKKNCQAVVAHTLNPSTPLVSLRPAWSPRASSRTGTKSYRATLSRKSKKKMCAVLENALSLWTRPLHTALTLREDAESPVGPSAWYVCLRAFATAVLGLRGSYSSLATQSQIPFSLAFPRCLFTSEDSALILRIILA